VRLIVLVLAIVMMAGTVAQVHAAADVACALTAAAGADDVPDVATPIVPEPVTVVRPDVRTPVQIEAPLSTPRGRMHAVLIFRPPRLVASR
jgi:hypothetical protein